MLRPAAADHPHRPPGDPLRHRRSAQRPPAARPLLGQHRQHRLLPRYRRSGARHPLPPRRGRPPHLRQRPGGGGHCPRRRLGHRHPGWHEQGGEIERAPSPARYPALHPLFAAGHHRRGHPGARPLQHPDRHHAGADPPLHPGDLQRSPRRDAEGVHHREPPRRLTALADHAPGHIAEHRRDPGDPDHPHPLCGHPGHLGRGFPRPRGPVPPAGVGRHAGGFERSHLLGTLDRDPAGHGHPVQRAGHQPGG